MARVDEWKVCSGEDNERGGVMRDHDSLIRELFDSLLLIVL